MPRSLVRGDYSLVIAIESSSRPNSWYRVLADRQTGLLSCDCPPYIFNRNHDAEGKRFCPHTVVAERLVGTGGATAQGINARQRTVRQSSLLTATQQQWPGLRGTWGIEQRDAQVGTKPYHFVLLRLGLGNGGTATGVVAFATQHHHSETEMIGGVAGWAGYAIAAEVARLGGFPLVGQLPEYFRVDRRPSTGRRQQPAPSMPSIGLADILMVGDIVDQGDGLTPAVRAANTLKLFLGEETFAQVERQGFLDVSSARHQGRVYRLRRDPLRERRIRVMEGNSYIADHCIVSSQQVPPDDLFLTVMLGLLSDEEATLAVVNPRYNIFPPHSDGREQEVVPAVWRPRTSPVLTS